MNAASSPALYCVIDERVLLLGIDALYRRFMEALETTVYLPQIEILANALGVQELDVPVEGYYINSPKATRYFRLLRALQTVRDERLLEIENLPEYQGILKLVSSPIYGEPAWNYYILPRGRDPLSQALLDTINIPWEAQKLIEVSYQVAMDRDDFSLVGLAARLRDPILMTALRESVILYAEKILRGMVDPPRYEYIWKVSDQFARTANRFIEEFNHFIPESRSGIPAAEPANAGQFFHASTNNKILGRCANLGSDPRPEAIYYYHWAITQQKQEPALDEFWSTELWTTERYRSEQERRGWDFSKGSAH